MSTDGTGGASGGRTWKHASVRSVDFQCSRSDARGGRPASRYPGLWLLMHRGKERVLPDQEGPPAHHYCGAYANTIQAFLW